MKTEKGVSKDFLRGKINKFKNQLLPEFKQHGLIVKDIQIFGSILTKRRPRDVDCLVIIKKVRWQKFEYARKLLYQIEARVEFHGYIDAYVINGVRNKKDKAIVFSLVKERLIRL